MLRGRINGEELIEIDVIYSMSRGTSEPGSWAYRVWRRTITMKDLLEGCAAAPTDLCLPPASSVRRQSLAQLLHEGLSARR